jgi:hypothetical protein
LGRISIYTTSSAFRGISVISSFKTATAAINSTFTKHQISTFSSCFLQLLSNSSPATAASQQQQPKQTDPKYVYFKSTNFARFCYFCVDHNTKNFVMKFFMPTGYIID